MVQSMDIQGFLSTVIARTITGLTLSFHYLSMLWTPMDYQHECDVTEGVKTPKWHNLCSHIHYEGQEGVALFAAAVFTINELNASGEICL